MGEEENLGGGFCNFSELALVKEMEISVVGIY